MGGRGASNRLNHGFKGYTPLDFSVNYSPSQELFSANGNNVISQVFSGFVFSQNVRFCEVLRPYCALTLWPDKLYYSLPVYAPVIEPSFLKMVSFVKFFVGVLPC